MSKLIKAAAGAAMNEWGYYNRDFCKIAPHHTGGTKKRYQRPGDWLQSLPLTFIRYILPIYLFCLPLTSIHHIFCFLPARPIRHVFIISRIPFVLFISSHVADTFRTSFCTFPVTHFRPLVFHNTGHYIQFFALYCPKHSPFIIRYYSKCYIYFSSIIWYFLRQFIPPFCDGLNTTYVFCIWFPIRFILRGGICLLCTSTHVYTIPDDGCFQPLWPMLAHTFLRVIIAKHVII